MASLACEITSWPLRRDEISRRTRISDTVMFLWCCLFKLPVFVSRDDDNLLERLKLLRATAEPGDIALNLSFTFKQ